MHGHTCQNGVNCLRNEERRQENYQSGKSCQSLAEIAELHVLDKGHRGCQHQQILADNMSGRLIYHPKHVMGQNAGKQNSIEQVYGIGLEGRFTDAQDVDEGMVPGG